MELETLSFEDAFGQLDQTVTALERGELSLERSLDLFERGMLLVRHCNALLDNAELRVRQLVPQGDGYAVADLER